MVPPCRPGVRCPAEACPVSARLLRSRRAGGGVSFRCGRVLSRPVAAPGEGPRSWAVRYPGRACPSGPFKEHGPPGCQAGGADRVPWGSGRAGNGLMTAGKGLPFQGPDPERPRDMARGPAPVRPAPVGGGLGPEGAGPGLRMPVSRGRGWQEEVKEGLTGRGRGRGGAEEMRTSLRIAQEAGGGGLKPALRGSARGGLRPRP
jgi:hypothetical protein